MQLADKRALVTGGGTGVGFGCARRLLEHGAEVLIVGRRDDVLEEAVGRLKAIVPEGKVSFQVCDITVEDEVVAAVKTAAGEGGLEPLDPFLVMDVAGGGERIRVVHRRIPCSRPHVAASENHRLETTNPTAQSIPMER